MKDAMRHLQEAESGIYMTPSRVDARKMYQHLNQNGYPCDLLTGLEEVQVPNARLTSATMNVPRLFGRPVVEVAVIDAVDGIADRRRGWVWTRALLGLRARHIYLCGEPSVMPVIKDLCDQFGCGLTVQECHLPKPPVVLNQALKHDWSLIQKGDCVVAHSRKDIFAIKNTIEDETGLQCAVSYRMLPEGKAHSYEV